MTTPFPRGKVGSKVEIYYDGDWHDITPDVRGLGSDDGEIEIGPRGQPDETSSVTPTIAKLALKNSDGKYSSRNVLSPLLGKIGKNTPLRIGADVGAIQPVIDHFNVNSASAWPPAESGHTYSHSGAAATQFIVTGGEAYHRHAAANTTYTTTIGGAYSTDYDVYLIGCRVEAILTGAGFVETDLRVRIDGGDRVEAFLLYLTGGTVEIGVRIRDGFLNIFSTNHTVVGALHTDFVTVRMKVERDRVRVKAWKTTVAEPVAWDFDTTTPNLLPGTMEINTTISAGITNAMPFDFTFTELKFNLGIILCTLEVAEWPKKWDITSTYSWTPIIAAGLTRRLRQGNKPIRSALFRYLSNLSLIGYWDFENLTDQPTKIFSPLSAARFFQTAYSPEVSTTFSANTGLEGSGALPTTLLNSAGVISQFYGNCNLNTVPTTHNQFSVVAFIYSPIVNNVIDQFGGLFFGVDSNSTDLYRVAIEMYQEDVAGVDRTRVHAIAYNQLSAVLIDVTGTLAWDDKWHMIRVTVDRTAGLLLRIRLYIDEGLVNTGTSAGVIVVGQPKKINQLTAATTNSAFPLSYGHLGVASGVGTDAIQANAAAILYAAHGYMGELATTRLARLFNEGPTGSQAIYFELRQGTVANGEGTACGPQKELNFVDLIQETVRADDGVLYELKDPLGYGVKTRVSQYGLSASLTLDYNNTDLSDQPDVTDDDQRTRNKITAKRLFGGETVTVERLDGPLSTNEPTESPPGAGLYDIDIPAINVNSASQLPDYAAHRLMLGTWDEDRWPAIRIYLERTVYKGNLSKLTAAAFLEIAEIINIVNAPVWLGLDTIVQQIRSAKIFLSNFSWGLEWATLPGRPWTDTGKLENATFGRLDTQGTVTSLALSNVDTDIIGFTSESVLPYCDALWTEDPSQTNMLGSSGFDLRINHANRAGGLGGERVTVPNVYALTDTFTRVAAQLAGTNADTGQTWVTDVGVATDTTVTGTRARQAHTLVNNILQSNVPSGAVDGCMSVDLIFPSATALTANIECHIGMRHTDANNNYRCCIVLLAGTSTVAMRLIKTVGGVITQLTNNFNYAVNAAATPLTVKVAVVGRTLMSKVWRPDLGAEPDWQIVLPDAAGELMTSTAISLRSRLEAGNTNTLPYNIEWDNLRFNTIKILPAYYDYFNRTTVNGMGTANSGGVWTTSFSGAGGSINDYDVAPNAATTVMPDANAFHLAFLDDVDIQNGGASLIWTCPLATGASLHPGGILLRGIGTNTYIWCRTTVTATATITLEIIDTNAGVDTTLASTTIDWLTHVAATPMRVKAIATGSTVAMKIWIPSTSNEPKFWQLRAVDPAPANGWVGFRNFRAVGNTNVNPTPSIANFRVDNPQRITVTRGVNGGARAWDVGSDVRLWTPLRLSR